MTYSSQAANTGIIASFAIMYSTTPPTIAAAVTAFLSQTQFDSIGGLRGS